ncbi:MAG: hypothetical protein EOP83_12150 [Verrucomicrobiaceae bacterium]|nr:MAG: hypothetical protein EOP83_12150 [Verrucomicrobiaceae bacterium]
MKEDHLGSPRQEYVMDLRAQKARATEARNLCKTAMVDIRNFVLKGTPIDQFVMSLLRRDESRAMTLAHPTLLAEDCVEQLAEFVETHIPAGMFSTDDEIRSWSVHDGLNGATEQQRMWLWMMSSWWKPSASRNRSTIQAVA